MRGLNRIALLPLKRWRFSSLQSKGDKPYSADGSLPGISFTRSIRVTSSRSH